MKTKLITTALIVLSLSSVYGNNLENIYGKNDLDFERSDSDQFRSSFASILEEEILAPHHIDITSASEEVESLNEDVNRFKNDISHYEERSTQNRAKIVEMTELLDKIDLLLIKLRSTSADLYVAKESNEDSVTRGKIQLSIEENRQQIYDLSNKKSSILSERDQLEKSNAIAERLILLNNLFLRKTSNRIAYLESCIEFSGRKTGSVDSLMEKSTAYQNEVDSLVNVSF